MAAGADDAIGAAIQRFVANGGYGEEVAVENFLRARGGVRQRRERCPIVAPEIPASVEAATLEEQWAIGAMSAVTVQRIGAANKQDADARGIRAHPEMEEFARLGQSGLRLGQCAWDMRRRFRGLEENGLPTPLPVEIPLLDMKKSPPEVVYVTYGIHLMHEVSGALWVDWRHEFNTLLLGDPRRD